MISIVIPLYNKEVYVETTINSVLAQTFDNYEIIIVDDGSTDNSATIVKSIQDSRINIIQIKNSGVSVARNIGIKTAKFDWIAFIDADDWWSNDFLEEMVKAIKCHPEKNLFCSGRSFVTKNGQIRYSNHLLPLRGEIGIINHFEVIASFLPIINMSNSIVSKKRLFEIELFKIGMRNHEDHDLWLRMAVNNPIVMVNKPLSFYRKDIESSASNMNYDSKDFIIYMETIQTVKNMISYQESMYLQKYANKFIFLSFVMNYHLFSETEIKETYTLANKIVTAPYKYALKFLRYSPYRGYYKVYGKIKGLTN